MLLFVKFILVGYKQAGVSNCENACQNVADAPRQIESDMSVENVTANDEHIEHSGYQCHDIWHLVPYHVYAYHRKCKHGR